MDLLYFAFQFYLNLRLAAFVSHFYPGYQRQLA